MKKNGMRKSSPLRMILWRPCFLGFVLWFSSLIVSYPAHYNFPMSVFVKFHWDFNSWY